MRTWSRRMALVASGVVLTLLFSGAACGPAAGALARIVLRVAATIVIEKGIEYVAQLGSGEGTTAPTVRFVFTGGARASVTFGIEHIREITISAAGGVVDIEGGGCQWTIRVGPETTTSIEIVGREGETVRC